MDYKQVWQYLLLERSNFPSIRSKRSVSREEWFENLPLDAYRVLFKRRTEQPFSSVLNDEMRPGFYSCRACQLSLFTAEMKFDSGTGWPSFFNVIEPHIGLSKDYKCLIPRIEYHCARCGGHQGHLFYDGPEPTGKRWCNNGVALEFHPSDDC